MATGWPPPNRTVFEISSLSGGHTSEKTSMGVFGIGRIATGWLPNGHWAWTLVAPSPGGIPLVPEEFFKLF